MKWLVNALSTSVGKKCVLAITGLLLCGFLAVHLAGNLLLYVDSDGAKYNEYAKSLHANQELLWVAEIGLLLLFLAHILLAFKTVAENRAARKVRYRVTASKIANQQASVRPDSWMFVTGAIVLGFIILHLIDFRFGLRTDIVYSDFDHNEAGKAAAILGTWQSALAYTLGAIALGLHLAHGVSSAFQSLGANHPKYESLIRWGGILFAAAIAIGFISFPIRYYLFR